MPKIPADTDVHFGNGTFITTCIQAKEGWRVDGRGKDRTTLKLAHNALTSEAPGHTELRGTRAV